MGYKRPTLLNPARTVAFQAPPKGWRALLAWPLAATLAGAIIYWGIASQLASVRTALQQAAYTAASQLAQGYADQLTRTAGHVDQIIRMTAHQWHQGGEHLDLSKQAHQGLYPSETTFLVAITDPSGRVVSSLREGGVGVDLSNRSYLQSHQRDPRGGLIISYQADGRVQHQPTIVFSRSLLTPAGAFAGVVFASVQPRFFLSSYSFLFKNVDDLLFVASEDGTPLFAQQKEVSLEAKQVLTADRLPLPARVGVSVVPGAAFRDGENRIVAWTRVAGYPLLTAAALSEKEVYQAYAFKRREYDTMFGVACVLLAILAAAGMSWTVRRRSQQEQDRLVKSVYRLATDNANEAFFMLRSVFDKLGTVVDFVIEDCNAQGNALVSKTGDSIIGKRLSEIYAHSFPETFRAFSQAQREGFAEHEFTMRGPDRKVHCFERRVVGGDHGLAVTLRDVTEIKRHASELDHMANTDALTGAPNRHWLATRLPVMLEQAKATQTQLAVLYLDLNDFKRVNTTSGHTAGDRLLREIAQRIQQRLGPERPLVRLGGDEFAVLVPQLDTADAAIAVAQQVFDALAEPIDTNDYGVHQVGASIGISLFPQHGADRETLFLHADLAMFAAKKQGKGTCLVYTPTMSDQAMLRIRLEQALRDAVARDEFEMHYQPRVDTLSGKLCAMEALIRWQRPSHGLLFPDSFIPIAEETGLIVDLGALVVEKVCTQLARWRSQGVPLTPISVNVSAREFATPGLKTRVLSTLARHDIPAELLELEITESCMMTNPEEVCAELSALKSAGILLSVDDFGTGYSNLASLQRLDIDVLKVDKSFAKLLTSGDKGLAFYRTIVSMGHLLGMEVVAEGVETEAELKVLQSLGCNQTQGYLISKPLPSAQAAAFLVAPTGLPAGA